MRSWQLSKPLILLLHLWPILLVAKPTLNWDDATESLFLSLGRTFMSLLQKYWYAWFRSVVANPTYGYCIICWTYTTRPFWSLRHSELWITSGQRDSCKEWWVCILCSRRLANLQQLPEVPNSTGQWQKHRGNRAHSYLSVVELILFIPNRYVL